MVPEPIRKHYLSEIDEVALRATCRVCGDVAIRRYYNSKSGWACSVVRERHLQRRRKGEKAGPTADTWHRISNVDEVNKTGVCSKCGPVRVVGSSAAAGFRCRPMTQERKRLRSYGLAEGAYEALLASQEGSCGICKTPQERFIDDLHVDHDHETGVVRGILCSNCNTGLGLLGDSENGLVAALEYLRRIRNHSPSQSHANVTSSTYRKRDSHGIR